MARKLPIPNGRLDGALDANGQRIVNLVDPMSGDDAATKKYVDESLGNKQDKLDPSQLAAVSSGITAEKVAQMVTKSDVEPLGDGTEVIARIGGKEIKIPSVGDSGSIYDSAGNVINADGGVVVADGSWSCNGIVLKRIAENQWENAEYGYGLGFLPGFGRWVFGLADGSGVAEVSAPSDAKKLAFQINGTTYNLTLGRADSLLTTSDVQPEGSGTVVIATIGGKQIKAPAGGGVSADELKKKANAEYDATWYAPTLPGSEYKYSLLILKTGDRYGVAIQSKQGLRPHYVELDENGRGYVDIGLRSVYVEFMVHKSSFTDVEPSCFLFVYDEEGGELLAEVSTDDMPADSLVYKSVGRSIAAARSEILESVEKIVSKAATVGQVDDVSAMAKYPVVQKSGTTVMLEDRKVNVYSGTLSSDVTLVLPARNADGRVRDLEFRANVSGLQLVGVRRTDASGTAVALFSMSPESAPAEEGVNVWYFTETGGEVRVERALLKPSGYQVKMDFTCNAAGTFSNDVDFLGPDGEKIKSISFKKQNISEIVSGVASLRFGMSSEGSIAMNGTTYYYVQGNNPRTIMLTGDSAITYSWADSCLTPDTPILTPSGRVPLKDVHVGDTVLGVDHRGVLRTVRVTRCDTHLEKWAGACDRWTFGREDGEKVVVTTVNRHRFYNVERGAMVYMDEWDIGEHGRDSDGCDLELVSHEHVDEPTRHMTLFTETQTYFANGLLSGNRHTPHIDWEDR